MKNIIKSVAIFLVLTQLFTGIVFGANVNSKEAFLEHIGVIEIFEDYNPDEYVTRIEFVDMVLKMNKINPNAIVAEGVEPFFDVSPQDDIFDTAVAAYQLGIIKGGTDGCFRPDAKITQDEAIIIVLRALGAEDAIEYADGGYSLARRLGLYDNFAVNKSSGVTRRDSATLIYNAMKADAVEKKSDGSISMNQNSSILGELYGLKYKTAVIEANYKTSLYGEDLPEYNTVIIDGETYTVTDPRYNEMIGVRVVVYYNESDLGYKDAVYIEEEKTLSLEMELENIYTFNDEEIEWIDSDDGREMKKRISSECITVYNNSRINRTDDFKMPLNGELKAIDNNDDNLIDVIIITAFDAYKIKSVSPSYNRINLKNFNNVIELNDYEKVWIDDADGNEIGLSEMKEDDIAEISVSPDGKYISITIVRKQKHGTIMEIRTDSNRNFQNLTFDDGEQLRTSVGYEEKIKVGTTGVFLMDSRGYICAVSDSIKCEPYTIAAVMGVAVSERLETEVKVKLYATDEKVHMLTVPDKIRCLNYGTKISNETAADLISASEVIRYSAKDGELTAFEYASSDTSYDGLCKFATLPVGNGADNQYWKTAGLIGGKIPVDSNTVIITYNADDRNNEKKYSIGAMSGLVNQAYYPGFVAYRVGHNEIYADVIMSADNNGSAITKDSPVMLVTEVSEVYDEENEEVRTSVKGFVENTEKNFILSDNNLLNYQMDNGDIVSVGEGDCIRYILNNKNEIAEIIIMYDCSQEKILATDGEAAFGGRINYRKGKISEIYGNYLKLILDGKVEEDEYLYSLNNAGLYQVSERNGKLSYEIISAGDLVSLKNDPNLKDKVFAYLVYANTKIFVVYKN